jgi:potassium-transporting ATPase ATP-binding subunit
MPHSSAGKLDMAPEQLDTPPQRQGAAPGQSEPEVTLRQKFRSAEDRVAAGKARIAEPYGADLLLSALIASLWKFDPRVQLRNPVMFVVWLGAVVTAALTMDPGLFGPSGASAVYNGVVTTILLLTVWFANFAEALAEGRGKAKAASLRRTRMELMARRVLLSGEIEQVPATALHKDDMVRVEKGEIIPADGEVIEGVAYVDESAITGESAPVLKGRVARRTFTPGLSQNRT